MMDRGSPRGEIIRIIIASDVREHTQELNLLLEQTYIPIEVIATAGTRQCLQMARDFQPDVILFIDEQADVPATEISREVYQSLPGVSVIILAKPAKQENPQYLRQALLAGARDVLPLRPLLDTLITSLQQATLLEKGRRHRVSRRGARVGEMGKVIVVNSAKGGTGRSVLAANLGMQLARTHPDLKVVLFDLDLYHGDQRVLLDLEPTSTVLDLLPVIDELTPDAVDSALITHSSGLRVLLAPPEPQQADMVEPEMVRKILIALRAFYNLILVDMPGGLSEIGLTALDFADQILQVCTSDVLCIRRTRAELEICDALGITPDQIGLVLNQVSRRDEIRPEEFRTLFEYDVLAELPDDPTYVQPLVNRGLPLVGGSERPALVKELEALAEELVPAPPAASG